MHTESVHAVQYVNDHHCESLQILPQNQCRTREVCGIILDLLVGHECSSELTSLFYMCSDVFMCL